MELEKIERHIYNTKNLTLAAILDASARLC